MPETPEGGLALIDEGTERNLAPPMATANAFRLVLGWIIRPVSSMIMKNNHRALVFVVFFALTVHVLRNGSFPSFWSALSEPVVHLPRGAPAADFSAILSRLPTIERTLQEFSADSRHSQSQIDGHLSKSISHFLDELSALDSRLTGTVSEISEASSHNREVTARGINALNKTVHIIQRKIQDMSLYEQGGGKGDATLKSLQKLAETRRKNIEAQWNIVEGRIETIESRVKDALNLVRSLEKPIWSTNGVTDDPPTITSTTDQLGHTDEPSDSIGATWSIDAPARPDFALYAAGARSLPSLTSATYRASPRTLVRKAVSFVTRIGERRLSAVNALHPANDAGQCWPFRGSKGQLGVKLARRAYISDISIDHVPKALGFDLRSAPRQMEVWGLVEGQENIAKATGWLAERQRQRSDASEADLLKDQKDEQWGLPKHLPGGERYLRIAEFLYDPHSTKNLQTFPVAPEVMALGVDFGVVVLVVKSNWGLPEFTCLYRFRVHGEMVGLIPPLYNPPSEERSCK